MILCLASFASAIPALAMTWQEAVVQVKRANPDLAEARANLQAARHEVGVARSGYYPELSAHAGSDVVSDTASGSEGESAFNLSLGVTQNIYAGGADLARVTRARAGLEATDLVLSSTQSRLSRELKVTWAALRFAEQSVELTERILRRIQENVRLVDLRFEGGRENKGAQLLTRAQVAQEELNFLKARQSLATAQADVARLLGIEAQPALLAEDDAPFGAPPTAPDIAALARVNPEVVKAGVGVRSAAAATEIARAAGRPQIGLTASLGRSDDEFLPEERQRSVGLDITLPLFSGGRIQASTQTSVAGEAAARAVAVSTEARLRAQLTRRHTVFVAAVAQVGVDRSFLEAAKTRAEVARVKYNNGLMSFEDWDRIESDLIVRERQTIEGWRIRIVAEAEWEEAQGRGVLQ